LNGRVVNLSRAALVASSLLLPVVLAGCAVDGTGLRPGVGVSIEDESVSVSEIDELAREFCIAVEDQVREQGAPVPLSLFTSGIANQQLTKLAVDQMAEDRGLEVGPAYASQVALLEQDAESVPAAGREAFVEIQATPTYIGDLLVQIGEDELGAAGATLDDAAKQAAGEQALGRYFTESDVEIDPRYGLGIVQGQLAPLDGRVSVAVTDIAKDGLATLEAGVDPDAEYVASLPDPATCG
jgi:hypothetical protein